VRARSCLVGAARSVAGAAGVAAGVYATYVAVTWFRYGHPPRPSREEADPLLDQFMPAYDVVERHVIRVNASSAMTLEAARNLNLFQLPAIRLMLRGRELILGSTPDTRPRPQGLLAHVQSLGWVVLAEIPEREIVVGAVTRPWEPNVKFRSVRPDEFAAFAEPEYVKIVWTLRADPSGRATSTFRTETRAVATDRAARVRFRRYWSLLSPGILLIRWISLQRVKAAAEERARAATATAPPATVSQTRSRHLAGVSSS
jgi:hypothetical protein